MENFNSIEMNDQKFEIKIIDFLLVLNFKKCLPIQKIHSQMLYLIFF